MDLGTLLLQDICGHYAQRVCADFESSLSECASLGDFSVDVFRPNTHLTGEALGLFYIGTIFPEFKESERWRTTGLSILNQQLNRHVQSDGVYFEQSTYYHRYTTDFYLHLKILLEINASRSHRVSTISSMRCSVISCTSPGQMV
jgi:hypothetical protein